MILLYLNIGLLLKGDFKCSKHASNVCTKVRERYRGFYGYNCWNEELSDEDPHFLQNLTAEDQAERNRERTLQRSNNLCNDFKQQRFIISILKIKYEQYYKKQHLYMIVFYCKEKCKTYNFSKKLHAPEI